MRGVLTGVWFAAAICGVVAAVIGIASSGGRRRVPMIVAAFCFAVAGVLGILSIGIVFLALSAVCFAIAMRTDPTTGG